MVRNSYHFVSDWRVRGDIDVVAGILADPVSLPRWWPSVYLSAEQVDAEDPDKTGPSIRLRTRGRLPYILHWSFRVTEITMPHRLALEAWGDFEGQGVWTLRQDGPMVALTYDWHVRANKPLLRRISWLLRPLFSWNHCWAMAQGEESLRRELARRDAAGPNPLRRRR